MSTHTPLAATSAQLLPGNFRPWLANIRYGEQVVAIAYGDTSDEAEHRAALIVRAVNAHAGLVAALAKCVTWAETYQRATGTGDKGPLGQDIASARKALADLKT